MGVIELTWDSDFFGYKVGKIELLVPDINKLREVLRQSKANGYKLIYVFLPFSQHIDQDILLKYNGILVDKKITYRYEVQDIDKNNIILEEYDGDACELYPLAYESGKYSRFFTDEKFGENTFQLLYQKWVENSIDRIIADKIFIFRVKRDIVGFVTLKFAINKAIIGLIAVDYEYRGKKIGHKLINCCKKCAINKSLSEILVSTQLDNKAACSFYEKNGFSNNEIINVYHFWL